MQTINDAESDLLIGAIVIPGRKRGIRQPRHSEGIVNKASHGGDLQDSGTVNRICDMQGLSCEILCKNL